ncbi:MAG: FtsX-like permease family protein [Chloroflexi bacterium]|nr:FtsX-like permease family protein [Chloroflexota bacterium]
MTALFGFPLDDISRALWLASLTLLIGLCLLALARRVIFKIAMRQLPRRRAQMVLITLGLSLGSSIITSVFLTGDTVQTAIHLQVVEGLGRVDEILHAQGGPYVSGDVDLTNLTGMDTHAPRATSQNALLQALSSSLTGMTDPPPEEYFPYSVYSSMQATLRRSPTVRSLLPAIVEQHALLTDSTSRQIRGQVKVIGLPAQPPSAFGRVINLRGRSVDIGQLPAGSVAINATAAIDLGASAGDRLLLFLRHQKYSLLLSAVVRNGGLAGAAPAMLLPMQTMQSMLGHTGAIDRILVVNRGVGDAAAAARSDSAAYELASAAPPNLAIDEAKAVGLRRAEQAQEIFSRIFTLFALFAAGVGLLLVFLIFTMLAAERRPELGISRVVGMTRRDLVLMHVFEGTVYALVSAVLGLAFGIGLGYGIVSLMNRVLGQYGFGIGFVVSPRVAAICLGLGLLTTWGTVVVACWWATRLTISSAIRDLPEPSSLPASFLSLLKRPWAYWARRLGARHSARTFRGEYTRRAKPAITALKATCRLVLDVPASFALALIALCTRGPGLVLAGVWLAEQGYAAAETVLFAAGVSVAIIGGMLTLRVLLRGVHLAPRIADRVSFTLGGVLLIAYWSLPVDVTESIGLPPLNTGIEIFFLAGVSMVFGAVLIAMYNLDSVVRPLARIPGLPGRITAATRTAAAYTLHRPARTALILAMFGLVSFTVTVMAVVTNALERAYGDVAAQTGGFDIRGDLLYNSPIPNIKLALKDAGINTKSFSFAGSQAFEPVGVVQLNTSSPGWRLAYANILDGDFLKGSTFHLKTRAQGYSSDAAVWAAMQHTPGVAVIGTDLLTDETGLAMAAVGNGAPPPYVFNSGGATGFSPVNIWLADPRGGSSVKLTIIGVVDGSDGRHGGVIVPADTLARGGIPPALAPSYFRVRPGQDATVQARRLGSAFLEHGLQTTVLANAVWAQRGPNILLARLLQGFVALVLVLGIAGLSAAAIRSVVERRQQIGMMRALGMSRQVIRAAFLLESSLVSLAGLVIGVGLGLLLARNLFLANFFEQYQTGLTMDVPWVELGLLVIITYGASMVATLLPARLAGRVSPAEALLDR